MDFPKSVPGVGLVDGKFVDENQTTGQAGSLIPSKWGNAVTDEILGVLVEAGLVPDEENNGQLKVAIKNIISAANIAWSKITGKPTTVAGYGLTDALKTKAVIAGDLNTYTDDVRGSGSGLTNTPGGDAGFWYVDVQRHGAGAVYCRQMVWRVTGGFSECYIRHQNNGAWTAWDQILTGSAVPLPVGYFSGFALSNNVDALNTTINVGAGAARDSADAVNVRLAGTLRGILQAAGAWAAGDNQNKLDTGARAANSWYHVFAIRKTSDGTADILFSLSATAPAMPAGYAGFRRLGSVRTDASGNILAFTNVGRSFFWKTPPLDVNVTGVVVDAAYVLSVPTGVRVLAQLGVGLVAGEAFWSYRATDSNAIAPSYVAYVGGSGTASNSVDYNASEATVLTSTSAQAHFRTEMAASPFRVVTYGWTEF